MKVLRGLHFSYAYIDDVLVASTSTEGHIQHLRMVLECFKQYGVIIKPSKCVLGVTTLEFLGHQVNSDGIQPLEEKVKAILDFPLPSTHKKLRQFLGLINLLSSFCQELRKDCTISSQAINYISKRRIHYITMG